MLDIFNNDNSLPKQDTILPILRNDAFRQATLAPGVDQAKCPVTETLAEDLIWSFAFDLPENLQYVSADDMRRLRLDMSRLKKAAIENLMQRAAYSMSAQMEGDYFEYKLDYAPPTSIVFVSQFWTHKATEFGAKVAIAIPTREDLLYCSAKSTRGLKNMMKRIDQILEDDSSRMLSRNIYLWNGTDWKIATIKSTPK